MWWVEKWVENVGKQQVQRRKKSKNRFFRNVLFLWAGGRESWLVVLVTDILNTTLRHTVCWDEGGWRFAAFVRYGFFDLTMTKNEIKIESINWRGPFAAHKGCFSFFGGERNVPGQSRDDKIQANNWKLSSAVSNQIDYRRFLQLWWAWGISHLYVHQHRCDWSLCYSKPSTPHLYHPKHHRQRHWDGDGGTLPGYWNEESGVGALRGPKSRLRLLQGDPMGHEGPFPRPGWWDQGVVCVCVDWPDSDWQLVVGEVDDEWLVGWLDGWFSNWYFWRLEGWWWNPFCWMVLTQDGIHSNPEWFPGLTSWLGGNGADVWLTFMFKGWSEDRDLGVPVRKKHVVSKVFHGFLRIVLHIFFGIISSDDGGPLFWGLPLWRSSRRSFTRNTKMLGWWMWSWIPTGITEPIRTQKQFKMDQPGKCVGRCGRTCFSCANVQFQAWGFEYLFHTLPTSLDFLLNMLTCWMQSVRPIWCELVGLCIEQEQMT